MSGSSSEDYKGLTMMADSRGTSPSPKTSLRIFSIAFFISIRKREELSIKMKKYRREATAAEKKMLSIVKDKKFLTEDCGMNAYYRLKTEALKSERSLKILTHLGLILAAEQHDKSISETTEKWRMALREMTLVEKKVREDFSNMAVDLVPELSELVTRMDEFNTLVEDVKAEEIRHKGVFVRLFHKIATPWFKVRSFVKYKLWRFLQRWKS